MEIGTLPRTCAALGGPAEVEAIRDAIATTHPTLAPNALRLIDADRGRIFRFWHQLEPAQRMALLQQVAHLDLALLEANLALLARPETLANRTSGTLQPPPIFDPEAAQDAAAIAASGEEVLLEGWLAVVEGAGGTGSRFFKAGGNHPKGLYTVSPSEQYSFFEVRLDRLIALRRRFGRPIPYVVMVSEATDAETRAYFESHHYFGLRDEILIVRQRSLPYVEEVASGTYDLLLEAKDKVAVGGYGHADFTKHVLLLPEVRAFLARFGVRYVQWLQIDNPLAVIGDRYLLGGHRRVEPALNPGALAMSFVSLKKSVATEKAGILVRRGPGLAVWEYSDMDRVSQYLLEHQDGRLRLAVLRDQTPVFISPTDHREEDVLLGLPELPEALRAGWQYRWGAINPNLVVVTLQSALEHPEDNPPLAARKSCLHLDQDGSPGDRSKKFIKFEAFLFDGLNDGVVISLERETCFAPTKNAEGEVDSPISARRLMTAAATRRLEPLGWQIATTEGTVVELLGLLELDDRALADRVGRHGRIEAGALLSIRGVDVHIGDGLVVHPGAKLVIDASGEATAPLSLEPRVTLPADHHVSENTFRSIGRNPSQA